MTIWDIPGGRRFLDGILDCLKRGVSVVIQFPVCLPSGLCTRIEAGLGRLLRVCSHQCTDSPFEGLVRQFVPGCLSFDEDDTGALGDLCGRREFQGRLVWLRGLNEENWSDWCEFLRRYADVSHSISQIGRTLFVAPISTPNLPMALSSQVTIKVFEWNDVLDTADLYQFATYRLLDRISNPIRRSLLASCVSRTSSWCFDTASRLLDADEQVMLAPYGLLREMAYERGWSLGMHADWFSGTLSGNRGIVHAALESLQDPPEEIYRRLWSAQVSVLFPLVEYERRMKTRNLRYDLRNLDEVRNALAHNELLSMSTVDWLVGRE